MTRRFVVVLIALATIGPVSAQDPASAVPWANKFFQLQETPAVVVHDFGTVPQGTVLTHRFPITNIYAIPMQIMSDPYVSCGCVRVVKYTQKLESREVGYIDVEMDTRRFTQPNKSVTLQVRFGPKFQSTAVLQVKATARMDISYSAPGISFNVVAQGHSATQTIDIRYGGSARDFRITEVDASGIPNIDAKAEAVDRSKTPTFRLTANLKPTAESGPIQGQIVLRTTDPATPMLMVPVGGMVQAPISIVDGDNIRLDAVAVGEVATKNLIVRSNKPFRITKVDGLGDGLTLDYKPSGPAIQVLTLQFKPTGSVSTRRELIIHTAEGDSARALVDVSAVLAP